MRPLKVAGLLGRLMGQAVHGRRVEIAIAKALPPGLVAALHDGPGMEILAIKCFDSVDQSSVFFVCRWQCIVYEYKI